MVGVSQSMTLGALCTLVHMATALEIPALFKGAAATEPASVWDKTYKFKFFKTQAQLRLVDFKIEAFALIFAMVYLLLHVIGKIRNRNLAKAWIKTALPLLEDEFAFVGKEDAGSHSAGIGEGQARLVWNGGAEALAYASGRRGVDGLRVLFELVPYHDPIELVWNALQDIVVARPGKVRGDVLSLTFVLPYENPDNISGVFAVVDKTVLRGTRHGRFDLTFSKVLEGENVNEQRNLDGRFAIMSETGELTDSILGQIGDRGASQRSRVGLQAALNGPAGKHLYSLILSDQPEARPEEGPIPVDKRERRLVLTLRMPKSASQAQESLALIEAACNLVDALELGHAKLTNTTVAKLRSTRNQLDKELDEEANRWKKEEEEEARQAAKRKAEQEKFDKLSPAEQEKKKLVEKKRAQRKAQGKQTARARS